MMWRVVFLGCCASEPCRQRDRASVIFLYHGSTHAGVNKGARDFSRVSWGTEFVKKGAKPAKGDRESFVHGMDLFYNPFECWGSR